MQAFLTLLNETPNLLLLLRTKLLNLENNNNQKAKILKYGNRIHSNKKRVKTMWPFRNKSTQRGWSIFVIILGLLIMIVKPISNIIDNLKLNPFITGLIIAFVGFFYFMDIQ